MKKQSQLPIKVAVGGFGAIGKTVAKQLDQGLDDFALVAISARNRKKAEDYIAEHFSQSYEVLSLEALAEVADVIVECCPAQHVPDVAAPALRLGKIVVLVSVGALLSHQYLEALARENGGRILVPSGAIPGLDAVQSVALGKIHQVTMVTQKPPQGLAGAPAIRAMELDILSTSEPVKVFEGTAREAITGFPANINVAVALGLAGHGVDRIHLEIWADPTVSRNTHTITVKSDSADLTLKIENIPSEMNPKTGKVTPLSVISTLRRLAAPLVIGA